MSHNLISCCKHLGLQWSVLNRCAWFRRSCQVVLGDGVDLHQLWTDELWAVRQVRRLRIRHRSGPRTTARQSRQGLRDRGGHAWGTGRPGMDDFKPHDFLLAPQNGHLLLYNILTHLLIFHYRTVNMLPCHICIKVTLWSICTATNGQSSF